MALLLADLPGVEQVELDSPANVGDAWLAGPAGTLVPGLVRRPPEERVVLLAVRHVRRGAVLSSSAIALVESDEHEIRIDAGVISAVGDVDVAPPDENSGGILGAVCRISERND